MVKPQWLLLASVFLLACEGEMGPPGEDGMDGAPGVDGTPGTDGDDGTNGTDGTDGTPGMAGLACWDLNENGNCDIATEDLNVDNVCDIDDCVGEQGPEGPAGPAGAQGPQGPAGAQGPQGPQGAQGPAGAPGAQGPQGPAGAAGAQGPAGAAGPQGPSGVVSSSFTHGAGTSPTGSTTMFLAAPTTVSVASGQVVHVTSHKAMGTTAAGGALGLNLYICYRASGSTATPNTVGLGSFGNRVPQNTRITFGLSATITGLSGTYQVGLCGHPSGDANWNSNEWSYTTALVYDQ